MDKILKVKRLLKLFRDKSVSLVLVVILKVFSNNSDFGEKSADDKKACISKHSEILGFYKPLLALPPVRLFVERAAGWYVVSVWFSFPSASCIAFEFRPCFFALPCSVPEVPGPCL